MRPLRKTRLFSWARTTPFSRNVTNCRSVGDHTESCRLREVPLLHKGAICAGTPSPLLRDAHGRQHTYLRISLTERCNLRCQYCMPESGVELTPGADLLTDDELIRFVRILADMGVSKIRLTGGEPLLRKGIVDLCHRIRAVPGIQLLAITTNGLLLERHADALASAGVSHVNVSLDTLDPAKYMVLTRRNGFAAVWRGLGAAEATGMKIKVNCVVMSGVNDDELAQLAALTHDRCWEVRFIEYMPFNDNKWARKKMLSFMEMMDRIEEGYLSAAGENPQEQQPSSSQISVLRSKSESRIRRSWINEEAIHASKFNLRRAALESLTAAKVDLALVQSRRRANLLKFTGDGETARLFRLPAHKGTIGFIPSMTNHFCGTCNRLRLTADGSLKTCLFGGADDELSIRDLMRGVSAASHETGRESKPIEKGVTKQISRQLMRSMEEKKSVIPRGEEFSTTKDTRTIDACTSLLQHVTNSDGSIPPVSDQIIAAAVGAAVQGKRFAHGGNESPEDIAAANSNRPMITIGG